MSIIISKFKYLKNDACTTSKIQIQNIIMADHVNFGILLTKGEQVINKINSAFFFLSATADSVSNAESCCQEVKKDNTSSCLLYCYKI